jgi:NAD(P)-dependent dehydrogenase (short-subunit alcohol dehydrogenase family)
VAANESGAVVVTGASTGIGRATALHLDEAGYEVFAGVRKQQDAKSLKEAGSERLTPITLDVAKERSVKAAEQRVRKAVGKAGLAGLVNNAGVGFGGPVEYVPLDDYRQSFEVNYFGQIAVTQAFLPLLRQGTGTLVNMGAASGRVTVPVLGPISASKAALESLTDALRMELKHQGVGVTIIEPGTMETPIFEKSAASGAADGYAGSEATRRLYAGALEAVSKRIAGQSTSPVDGVVKTVVKALSSGDPDPRYVVGRDAGQLVMLRRFPQGLRDRLLMNNMGLTREAFETTAA